MKRLFFVSVIAITIISCRTDHDVTVAMSGVVNFVSGNVVIINANNSESQAKPGDSIVQGQKIITKGKQSLADIYIGSNAVRVMGNTTVIMSTLIAEIKGQGERVELFVEKGSVFSKVVKKLAKKDSFEVKTPTAIAGVRGTEFLLAQLNNMTRVSCLSGKVAVNDATVSDSSVILSEKEEVEVQPGKDLVKVQIAEDKLRKLHMLTNIRELQDDIKKKYLQQKEEIRKKFEEQREEIRKAVVDQREKDKALVEDQKKRDQEMISNAKGDADKKAKEAVNAAKGVMDKAKNVDLEAQKKAVEEQKKNVKPEMNVKPKLDVTPKLKNE